MLLHECSNFQKFAGVDICVVFDAQFVPGIAQSFQQYQLSVVFTKEDETADSYIERTVAEMNTRFVQVTVVTSDLAQQRLVFQQGALRKSAREFKQEIEQLKQKQREIAATFAVKSRRLRSPWNEQQWQLLDQLLSELNHR